MLQSSQNSARYFTNTQSGCVSVYICLSFYTAKKEASLQAEVPDEIEKVNMQTASLAFFFFFLI